MQNRPRHIAIEVPLANPFGWNILEMVVGSVVLAGEIADFSTYEIECECFKITQRSRIVVMKPGFRKEADLVAALKISGGKQPFGVVPDPGFEAAAMFIGLAAGHEALVENFSPGMNLHGMLDIRHVHLRFGFGQPVVGCRYRQA